MAIITEKTKKAAYELLLKKIPYREISKQLQISPASLTKIATERECRQKYKLTTTQKQEIVRMLRAGNSYKTVATQFNISTRTISAIAHQFKFKAKKRNKFNKTTTQIVVSLLQKTRLSYAQIATMFNVTTSAIQYIAKQNNCERSYSISIEERFWTKVDIDDNDECWIWKAGIGTDGYGMFRWDTQHHYHAHKAAYMLLYGDVADGLVICHHCDNPLCCNPNHLFCGTAKDNTQDMIKKQRDCCVGERNYRAKLNNKQVLQIIDAYKNKQSVQQIADRYNVSNSCIADIVQGRTWTHLTKIGG